MRRTARALAVVGVGFFARGAMGSAGTGSCTTAERCLGAIKTGFVADAASMGLHWIYDVEKARTNSEKFSHW
jgi:hypothetical protein